MDIKEDIQITQGSSGRLRWRETSNKYVIWNYNKVNGNYRYEDFTNIKAAEINQKISEEDDIEVLHDYILEVVEDLDLIQIQTQVRFFQVFLTG